MATIEGQRVDSAPAKLLNGNGCMSQTLLGTFDAGHMYSTRTSNAGLGLHVQALAQCGTMREARTPSDALCAEFWPPRMLGCTNLLHRARDGISGPRSMALQCCRFLEVFWLVNIPPLQLVQRAETVQKEFPRAQLPNTNLIDGHPAVCLGTEVTLTAPSFWDHRTWSSKLRDSHR